MKTKFTPNALRIGVTCFAAYLSCYFGKNLLSSMMPQLIELGVFDDITLGRMASLFLITYGSGQLINGVIGNRIRGRYMISLGLLVPGVLLLLFPFCTSPLWGTVLWGVCGFFCSMLWGPIAKMIGENTTPAAGEVLLTLMTVASTAGTLATQALAVLGGVLNDHKPIFLISATVLCTVAIAVFFYTWHLEKTGAVRVDTKDGAAAKKETDANASASAGVHSARASKLGFIGAEFLMMTVVVMLNGVVRNAVAFWIPTFLSQYFGYTVELTSALVMALPFFNIAGIFCTLWLLHRIKCNEKLLCAALFLLAVPLFGTLFVFQGSLSILSVIALFLASAVMMGVCNLIFSVYLLRFRDSGALSGISGFFDFASYLSAASASLFFTELMARNAWRGMIMLWCAIGAAGAVLSVLSLWFEKRKEKGVYHE